MPRPSAAPKKKLRFDAAEEARLKAEREAQAAREAAEAALRPKPTTPEPVAAAAPAAAAATPAAAAAAAKPKGSTVQATEDRPLRPSEMIQPRTPRVIEDEEEEVRSKKARPGAPVAKKPAPGAGRNEPKRRSGKLTIARALEGDEERQRSLASMKRAREREKRAALERTEPQKIVRDVIIPEAITVQDLAQRMAIRSADVIKVLMGQGLC